MTTIHPKGLAGIIAKGQPFELLDVRPRVEFDKSHIRGARSVPLPELQRSGVARDRGLMNPRPLFLVSRQSIQASLAAGILRGAGCLRPVIVDGGMELWSAQGFETVHPWHFHVLALRKRIRASSRKGLIKVRRMLEHSLLHRPLDKAWWYRYETQPRKVCRG